MLLWEKQLLLRWKWLLHWQRVLALFILLLRYLSNATDATSDSAHCGDIRLRRWQVL
jgi:hypothetical protein